MESHSVVDLIEIEFQSKREGLTSLVELGAAAGHVFHAGLVFVNKICNMSVSSRLLVDTLHLVAV